MEDVNIRDAKAHWAPRMIANGVDYNDFVEATSKVTTWESWCPEWLNIARRHEDRAAEAERAGDLLTAADAYIAASIMSHFGKFVWLVDPAQYELANAATVSSYRKAVALAPRGVEAVSIPYEGGVLPGYLGMPAGVVRPPVAVIICGLDSVKEEMHTLVPIFHARGIATLVFDGPGQGESENLSLEPAFEKVLTAVVDWVETRSDVDRTRIGALGISLGGYYVSRASAFERRIKCAASCGGVYHFGADFENLPQVTRLALKERSHSANWEEAKAVADRLNLAGIAEKIHLPFLVIYGAKDRLFPSSQAVRLFEEISAPGKRLELYENGNHVCNNMPHIWRPMVADWISRHLAT